MLFTHLSFKTSRENCEAPTDGIFSVAALFRNGLTLPRLERSIWLRYFQIVVQCQR